MTTTSRSKIDFRVRRWCEVCRRFTPSQMIGPYEACAVHVEPDEDEEGLFAFLDDEDEDW